MIRDSGEHLLRIINDILDLARIEAGQARLEEKELSLKELVEKTVFGFELRAKRKGLELNTIYPSDLPLEIRADEGKLSQVLTNLVDNALKFTQQGKVEVKLEKLADLNIRLQVKDTGIGISEQKLSRIFEKFYQVDGTSRRKYEGTDDISYVFGEETIPPLTVLQCLLCPPALGDVFSYSDEGCRSTS